MQALTLHLDELHSTVMAVGRHTLETTAAGRQERGVQLLTSPDFDEERVLISV